MEDVLEKLKLLDYESELSTKKKFTPCTRLTFALQDTSNASRQFKFLMDICSFLLTKCNEEFAVDKYDDPTSSVNKLLLVLKNMSIEVDFPATKIKQGYGQAVCLTLQKLTDRALSANGFNFAKPEYPKEEFADEAEVDEEAEVEADEEIPEQEMEEEIYSQVAGNEKEPLEESQKEIILATVDPIAWKTELERVGPKLKAGVKGDVGKEWRAHIEQMKKHEAAIRKILPNSATQLKDIGKELSESIERMTSKERYLNNQYDTLRQEYHGIKENLTSISNRCAQVSENVSEMSNEYATLTEQLSEIKSTMENRGSSMTDTSPLVKIKAALQALKTEAHNFELRIGIVGHTLLHAKSKAKHSRTSHENPIDPELDISDDEM